MTGGTLVGNEQEAAKSSSSALALAAPRPRAAARGWRSWTLRATVAATGLFLLAVVAVPLTFTPYDPFAVSGSDRLRPPSLQHPLGTDHLGRDLLSRVILGVRPSLLVAVGTVAVSLSAGLVFGLLAGFYRRLDNLLMRVMDGLMSFPYILLAIAVLAVLGRNTANLILAISVVYTPFIARITRSVILSYREATFVEAAMALGASDLRILARHLLPNVVPIIAVQATYFSARALLTEASLSFLGLGLPPEMPSWGTLLGDGRRFLRSAPWVSIFPGVAISLTVLVLNVAGDAIRDRLDPRVTRSNQ
jgi:peptide/nickel transport system permease protein